MGAAGRPCLWCRSRSSRSSCRPRRSSHSRRGANNLLAMQHGMRFGVTEAVIALTGRITAFAVMLGLDAAGLAAVLTRSQTMFELLKWAGIAYRAYLGIRSLVAPPVTADSPVAAGRMVRARRGSSRWPPTRRRCCSSPPFSPSSSTRPNPPPASCWCSGRSISRSSWWPRRGWALARHRLRLADLRDPRPASPNQAFGGVFLGLAGLLTTTKH